MLKFVYSNIFMQWYWWSCVFCLLFLFVQRCDGNEFIRQKPAADLAIFGDRSDRPKSPGVPGGAIAIFADRRFKQCARWCARPRIRWFIPLNIQWHKQHFWGTLCLHSVFSETSPKSDVNNLSLRASFHSWRVSSPAGRLETGREEVFRRSGIINITTLADQLLCTPLPGLHSSKPRTFPRVKKCTRRIAFNEGLLVG